MQTYIEAKARQSALEADVAMAQVLLATFPKGPMNLTPDAVRATPEFQAAKRQFDRAFQRLRAFNARFVKDWKLSIRAERNNRFAA